MRIYHFGNFYMSSIQQGIQAAHCQTGMSVKYKYCEAYTTPEQQEMYWDWAENHKTMICLNGGMNSDLYDILKMMDSKDNDYPWGYFNESREAMNGMLTNIAIVLPERIYETASKVRSREYTTLEDIKHLYLTEFENKLIDTLNSCSIAK